MVHRFGNSSEFGKVIIGECEILEHLVAFDDGLLHPDPSYVERLLSLSFIHNYYNIYYYHLNCPTPQYLKLVI